MPTNDEPPGRFADLIDENTPRANLALQFGVEQSPDDAAEAAKLARRYKLPIEVVSEFRDEYRNRAKADDAKGAVEASPKLKGWLAFDDNNAKMAHDDVHNLAGVEAAVRQMKGPEPSLTSVASGLLSAFPLGLKKTGADIRLQMSDLFESLGFPASEADKAERLQSVRKAQAEVDASTPNFESSTARGIYSGATSLIQQLPGIAASILTRNPAFALGQAGAQAEADAYGKYRARGANPGQALIGGAGEGAVEVATELLPMGFLVSRFGKEGAKHFLTGLLAREVPSEELATFLQDAIDTAVENPDKTWGEFMKERPDAAYQTLLATVVQGGVMGAADKATRRFAGGNQRATAAEEAATQAERLRTFADASALRERDADTFKGFVAQVADEHGDSPTELYVDGQVLANSLAQSGVSFKELEEVAPTVASQVVEAAANGGDVRIPVSEFAAAGENITAPLIDHLRSTPEGMSRAEAKTFLEEQGPAIEEDVRRALEQQQGNDEHQASMEKVRNGFEGQLNSLNRLTPEVNKAYADLLANFYAAQATRVGMTPEELTQRYGLKVSAKGIGSERTQRTLEQADTQTPQFKQWFGDSKVVDEGGKPMVMYHGTDQDFSVFSAGERGTIHFTSDKATASRYATNRVPDYEDDVETGYQRGGSQNVMPVYLRVENPYDPENEDHRRKAGVPWNLRGDWEALEQHAGHIREAGFDGILLDGMGDVAVFAPEQIKSATGNRGTFDPNSPNIVEQSGRLGGDTTQAVRAREALDGMKAPPLSSLSIVNGKAKRPHFKKITELAEFFTAKNRSKTHDLNDPKTQARIADAIFAEALHGITDAGNAIGWYDAKTKAALSIISELHPEIATDPQSRFSFIALLAVTSNGLRSRDNFVIAEQLYREHWKANGKFPESVPQGGSRHDAMGRSLELLNKKIEELGWAKVRDFMTTKHTAKEVRDFVGGKSFFGEQANTIVPGALFLGPKLGSFFNNLYGDFSTVTMDRWFMRTINRVRGRMLSLPASFADNLATLRSQIESGVHTFGVTPKRILADISAFEKFTPEQQADVLYVRSKLKSLPVYVQARHRDYAKPKADANGDKRSYLERTPENYLAKNIDMALNASNDAPFSAGDRTWIRGVMEQVQQRLADAKIEVSNADLQAVLWYYEKDLYDQLIGKDSAVEEAADDAKEAEDYETAARYAVARLQRQGLAAGPAGSTRPGDGPGRGSGATGAAGGGLNELRPERAGDGGGRDQGRGLAPLEGAPAVEGAGGEANRNAKVEDTVFADQKTGLMPEWTWTEGRVGDAPNVLDQSAFHGTHKRGIDRFSTDFIGSGEGAQVYGWGLYFAGKREIAEHYKKTVSDQKRFSGVETDPEIIAAQERLDAAQERRDAEFDKQDQALPASAELKEARSEVDVARAAYSAAKKKLGQVYTVELPEDSDLLDYDARVNDQPEKVRAALVGLGIPASKFWVRYEDSDGTIVLKAFDSRAAAKGHLTTNGVKGSVKEHPNDDTGRQVYKELSRKLGSDKAASLALRDAGIPGLRFRDANSRGDDSDRTFNYVVFDDSKVTKTGELYQTARGNLSFGDDITAAPSVITLLEGANLSTFIHESGHFFLEVQADLAMRIQQQISAGASVSAAERKIVDDMNTLLAWFGVNGSETMSPLDEWVSTPLTKGGEKEAMHEQFARGFEAFAMEGKSPSIALQGVFQRFRSWLMQVYKKLRNLNVTLTDDVRSVMGRMIASDLAIEEAEAQFNMGPLFKDAESAGMTLDEFSAYQDRARGATDAAIDALQTRMLKDMKWLSKAKDKALKAKQAEVDDIRHEVQAEVRAEVMAERVYQAWQFLTSKQGQVKMLEKAPGQIDTVQESGKLRTQVLRDMYGTAEDAPWRKLSERHMTSDEVGMHPEMVADIFGYDSADAMVTELSAAPPPAEVIDARTDQRMMGRYGDINSEEALERAANEEVHNEARVRFIASELKALQEVGTVREKRGRTSIDVMAQAAKGYAQQVIARLKFRELRPHQYAVAEARSARLAEKAFGAGKTEEAAMHKRNQLVNNYATKAAYAAQGEVKKAQAYFRKFDKRSKAIDPSYQDQIEALLERYDFRPVSLKDIGRRKSLIEWHDAQVAAGIEPNIPEELLNDARSMSYKDMTLEQIRGLRDTVKQIEHMGRLKHKLLLAHDKRDFEAAAAEMEASIIEHGGSPREVKIEPDKGVIPWLQGVAASHRKLASLFREMDGGNDNGPMYKMIGRAMNERGTMEDSMVEKATVALQAIYKPVMKLRGGTHGGKLFIKAINASLTRGGRLAVALNWGNEANRQRVRSGDKWSEAQVNAILETLTPTELKFVNDTWAYIDTYWPEVAAKEKRLTGVAPEKVEAAVFVVKAADGSRVEMTGGYYPLKYDTDRSDRAETQEAAQVATEMMQGAFTRSTTRRGHTKERLKEVKRPVRKDLNVITEHVTQVIHDLSWHEWLIDTNRLLGNEGVVEAIHAHYGPKVLKTIRNDITGIATADMVPQDAIDQALRTLRSNVTRATMGASLTTAFLQPFGLTQSMARIGSKHVLRGAARWGGDAVRMENTLGWIRAKSEFMRLRAKTFNRELREIKGSVAGKSAAMRAVDGGLFWFMQKMQLVADVPTWIGQYEKSLAEGNDEDSAVAQADRAVLESQGGGHSKDLAEVQRKHPMLTQFYSYFSVTLNLTAEKTAETDFKSPRAVAGWLGDMALLLAVPAILPSYLMFLLRGGDEDDERGLAKRVAEWQLSYLLGMMVGVRELSGAMSGFDYAGPPVGRIITDATKAGQQTAQGEIDEPAVLSYARLAGDAFGIPMVQLIRSYKGWKAWDEGEAGAQAVLFGPPPKDR